MSTAETPPVVAAVRPSLPSGGGFDANGAWHDGGNGRFAKAGWSTLKAAVLKFVKGAAAKDLAKSQPDGVDLTLGDRNIRARFHSDTHAVVGAGRERRLVKWERFNEPVTQQMTPVIDKPVSPPPQRVVPPGVGTPLVGGRVPDMPPAQPTVVPDRVLSAAKTAVADLIEFHHEDVGANGVTLPTLPTIVGGNRFHDRPLNRDTQLAALDALFFPDNPPAPVAGLPVLDAIGVTAPRKPLGMVAVNPETGAIIGTHAPWDLAGENLPPYGQWVSLPADHPYAADLVSAAWLASPAVKRYLTGNVYEPGLLQALREGDTPDNDVFPGLTEAVTARSDGLRSLLEPSFNASRHTDSDGTHFVVDPDGIFTLNADDVRFADRDETGGTRLWVDPANVDTPELPVVNIDYTDVDDPNASWDDRVAALKTVRAELQTMLTGTPDNWLTVPHRNDTASLIEGFGGEQELANVTAVERFGQSLAALVEAKITPPDTDKTAVMNVLGTVDGVPPQLVDLLNAHPWAPLTGSHIDSTNRRTGGYTVIRFADHPASSVVILTPSDSSKPVKVGWSFDNKTVSQLELEGWDTNHAITAKRSLFPKAFHQHTRPTPSDADDSPTLVAFTETMEALGIDMSTDPDVMIGSGRDLAAEAANVGSSNANAARLGDMDPDSELFRTADVGLRPFPKSWTTSLRSKLQRFDIDMTRDVPAGYATSFDDATIMSVPSIVEYPDFKDVVTHELSHAMERTVAGLITAETWHFIKRLRSEAAKTGENQRWDWGGNNKGYADEFGDMYMGKMYTPDITNQRAGYEILSTAAQQLHGHTPRSWWGVDEDARNFLVGLMSIVDPDEPEQIWEP